MLQRRNSKQRNVIREYLCGRIDHPTAEKLYKEIRLEHPKMSLGTVYRNLMFLTDIGEIQALNVGDGITHFDPNQCLMLISIARNVREYLMFLWMITKNSKYLCKQCPRQSRKLCCKPNRIMQRMF